MKTLRKIVRIDEEKCDGCGLCAPSCAEGAIKIIDGKARLLAENLCDGLGACLGECPRGAISIEERSAEGYDEQEVHRMKHADSAGGCPGSRMRMHERPQAARTEASPAAARPPSRLGHWPVQLTLLPESGPLWDKADLLFAADCAPFALADFHERLLAGKTLAVACPKLDDADAYVAKLARIFANNDVRSVTVVRMEVPCCGGLERIVALALAEAGKKIPTRSVVVDVRGDILG